MNTALQYAIYLLTLSHVLEVFISRFSAAWQGVSAQHSHVAKQQC